MKPISRGPWPPLRREVREVEREAKDLRQTVALLLRACGDRIEVSKADVEAVIDPRAKFTIETTLSPCGDRHVFKLIRETP